jgi:4-hydroxythreonine-4-phosphate dehydrogenase
MTLPVIGVTPGDPGGIGPEVLIKALGGGALPPAAYIVFAVPSILRAVEDGLGSGSPVREWRPAERPEKGVYLSVVPGPDSAPAIGAITAPNGEASYRAFEAAVAAARAGRLAAVVTGPVSKAAWALAGYTSRGHTEYLGRLYPSAIMAFWSDRLKIALFSHHIPLGEALAAIRAEALADFFKALHKGLLGLPGAPFRLIAAGLNPHAGEGGHLGREEILDIRPAVEKAAADGIPVTGPFPPDTVFLEALDKDDTVAVALYHDQGLIAFKMAAFATGVNVTLGLPFVRTSPDHGTAFDIAGKGVADPRSMAEALRLAAAFSATCS